MYSGLLYIFFIPLQLCAQSLLSTKETKLLQTARQQLKAKDYPGTLKSLGKLNPDLPEVMLLHGLVADGLNNKGEAVTWFTKVFAQAPELEPKLPHYLGVYFFEEKEYPKARAYFDQYLKSPQTIPTLIKSCKIYLEKLDALDHWVSQGADIVIKPVPGQINTDVPEYLPMITADDQMLFIRRLSNQEDLYISKRNGGQWQEPMPLVAINSPENEGAASISADGRWLVFTGCDRHPGMGSCDLYISEKTNLGWSEPKLLGPAINSPSWDAQPALNRDGTTLLFSSTRQGGHGGRDLWFSRKRGNQWMPAINLGNVINTQSDEETPYLHADGRTIYFASKGHPGLGQADLFMTYWSEGEKNWTQPLNLGHPINTPATEGGLVVALDGITAYFTRDTMKSGQRADVDIYTFALPQKLRAQPMSYVRLHVEDATTHQPLDHFLHIIQLVNMDTVISQRIQSPPVLVIQPAESYLISIQAEGYLPFSEHLSFDTITQKETPYDTTIRLTPIQLEGESAPVVLRNIFFATGSSQLLPASYPELDVLYNYLVDHPSFSIEIRGHTDNTGSENLNQQLSLARAKVVHDYLIKKGIVANRLSFAGFGASKPLSDNLSDSGRTLNRRTEFVIVKK